MIALALSRHRLRPRVMLALAALCALLSLWSLLSGATPIAASEAWSAIGRGIAGSATAADAIVLHIRLPRVLLALLVGAALAVAGAAMQGLFRNPLADPGLIGMTGGAVLGAVGVIVLGGSVTAHWLGHLGVSIGAFAGGLAATVLAWSISLRHHSMANLLLAGVAVTATAMALTGFLIFLADDSQLRDLTFWNLGSLGGADWSRLSVALPLILVPVLLLPRLSLALNAMLLGEHEAAMLGFRPRNVRRTILVLCAVSVSAGVAIAGTISFVGLVVPHLLRLAFGPDHRLLLPASAVTGGMLLVTADTLARTLVAPAELPIGVLTALIGGPFFFWLLLRKGGFEVR